MSNSTLSIKCPHCKSKAATRTSREITPVYRELYLQCSNIDCGHTYKAALSVVATVSPSAMPDPRIVIPMAPKRPLPGQKVAPANDDERVAANDLGPATTAAAGRG